MAARLRDIVRACAKFEISVQPGAKHFKAEKPGCRSYPIPAHNGERTEIVDFYISGLCRNFKLDEKLFRSLL